MFPHPITPYKKLIINAAITGLVHTKKDTPYIPISVEEIIEDSISCYYAGASIVHIHAREETGKPSYKKEIYARIIKGIRKKCPDLVISVSTSGRIHNTFKKRSQCLKLKGGFKPDMASLTLGPLNFLQKTSINTIEMIESLAIKMKENDIIPEIEVFEPGMINTAKVLIKKGILQPPLYFNIILGSIYSAPATLSDLLHMVQSLPEGAIWGATGIGQFQMTINFSAVLMGGNVRVGLEDNIYYDIHKKKLATNVMLIERIVNFTKEIGREIATPAEVRSIIGIK
ncbi:MAG: 3-keto-5-aminohexanoate cleavage protein [Candidatus Ratteibacteria bacterium]|nr:3-keto-5-aminohexanoate cleavage protein [Candidatus Ratteibacteria bacterium]